MRGTASPATAAGEHAVAPEESWPPPFPASEYQARIDRLRAGAVRDTADAAVILHPRDLIYFTGIETAAQLVVPAVGTPTHLVQLNLGRVRAEGPVGDVRPSSGLRTLRDVLRALLPSGGRVGVTLDVLPHHYAQRLAAMADGFELVDISDTVMGLRAVKSAAEVDVIRAAAGISRRSFELARAVARPGVAEFELQLEMQRLERGSGADEWMTHRGWNTHLGWGILCSGPRTAEVSGHWMTETGTGPSAAQPYGAGRRRFREGDLVLIDRGVVLHGYHCDEARTLVVGEPDERQARYWQALQSVLSEAVAAIRPGQPVSGVYDAAARAAADVGVGDFFMTRASHDFAYVGHGVGLEIDEPPLVAPRSRMPLRAGMVLALEPKVIVPGWGGLTLEDMVVVTEEGAQRLTSSPVAPLGVGPG